MITPPLLKIHDIVRIKRGTARLKTVNKSCFVLSCRLQGKSLFLYKNSCLTANRGDILYIPCGSSYIQEGTDEEIVYIHFEAYSAVAADIRIFSAGEPDHVCELFARCAQIYAEKGNGYEYRCLSVLYEILSLADIVCPQAEPESPLAERIGSYIEANSTSPAFSIGALCGDLGISRAYFNKLFKEHFKDTPVHYINSKRIEKAKLLLMSEHYTKEEIARLCGFCDVKYFYAVFKKLTGMTTRQYKNYSADNLAIF